jgi:hypothetical protein
MVSPLALLVSGTACGNSPAEFLEVQLEFDGRGTAVFDSAPGEKPFRQRCAWDDPAPCDVFSEAPVVGRASAAPGWGFFAWNLLDRSSFESELSFGVAVGGTGARVSGELVFLERDRADPRLLEVPIAARPGERIARGEDVELIAEIPDLPGLRFEWSDGEVGSRPRRWVSNLSETTTFTLDLYANDELLGRGAITIEVTEPGETSWPVEISWDPAGTVTVGGDVAEGSADVTSWTGTVLDRGTVELQASLIDPEGADVFLGWREEASCPVPDPSEPIATLSSVTRAVDCHAEFGAPSHPCGEVDVSQVEASFTIDGIPWDDLPVADPPVHDPSDPSSISLVASVSGVPMEHLVYQWEVKPFHAELDPPWISLQSCRINESSCDWNGTQLFWDDDPVAAGLIRLKVSGCAGEVDETVGPTRNGDGVETYVDFFP